MTSDTVTEALVSTPEPSPTEAPSPKPQSTVGAVPVVMPTQVPAAIPVPLAGTLIARCPDCSAWKRLNPRSAMGQCVKHQRYSPTTIFRGDNDSACSQIEPL